MRCWRVFGQLGRHTMTPGRCKGKAHQPEHLGISGRRVLVSRKWSNKTLNDHRAERSEFVQQLLEQAGIQPAQGPQDGPYRWERPAPTDPDVPPDQSSSCMPSPNDNDGSRIHRRPTRHQRPTTQRKLFDS
jgi:hypothetical protein